MPSTGSAACSTMGKGPMTADPDRGFLAVDKPAGLTSHDVVARVRKAIGIRKSGHAGTLDPMATGLLLVAFGPATRLIRFVQDLPKEYVATACFGVATDSLDADGAVIAREPMAFGRSDIEDLLPRFTGDILQVPPMVSALKVEGRRLYELAREGEEVHREPRPVTVHELEVIDVTPGPYPEVTFRVVCGKGTYVRSLADDMARALGGHAHLTALRRVRSGPIDIGRHGVGIDELDAWRRHLILPAEALGHLAAVSLDSAAVAGVSNGVRFARSPVGGLEDGTLFRILDQQGRLRALYRQRGSGAVAEVVLP